MKIKDDLNSINFVQNRAWTISSGSGQEQKVLLESNETNIDQCRLTALIDEALNIYQKREEKQDKFIFIFYCTIVLSILIAAIL